MKHLVSLPNRITQAESAVNLVFASHPELLEMAKYSDSLPESLARHIDDLPYRPAGHWYGGQPYYDIDGQIRIGHLMPYEPIERDGSIFKASIFALTLEALAILAGLTLYWIWRIL